MKRVLVATLDWGLGHATRCIPIIEQLQKKNCEVFIASNGSALALLRKEFPALNFFALPSYRIRYPKKGSFILSIIGQLPKINVAINQEHKRILKIVKENSIDLIISDSRYGCWSKEVPSVFISHQLSIQVPAGWKLLKPIVDWVHVRMIKRFKQCWVPDDRQINLTGELSKSTSVNTRFVGILSRFEKVNAETKYDVAFVLSGPEPQRTIFEEIVLEQIGSHSSSIIIVRGVVEGEGNWKQEGNITIVNFLSSSKLEEIVSQSRLVIARSGYSTIMDLARMGRKAVFVPTPGQTEQEYLAKKLKEEKVVFSVEQKQFNLEEALRQSKEYSGFVDHPNSNLLSDALNSLGL